MINILIVYDDLDQEIGENALLCYQHLAKALSPNVHTAHILQGGNCTSERVEHTIGTFEQKPFIFIAYSHGKEDKLISTHETNGYVNTKNAYFFGESLFYTNACFTALELRNYLAHHNCKGYVGYAIEVILPNDAQYDIFFTDCENAGIIHFLSTNDTLEASCKKMGEKYKEVADELVSKNCNVLASILLGNLDGLVFEDKDSVTASFFF